MGTILCLNCNQVLAEIEPYRNMEGGQPAPARCELEEEGEKTFYRCPRCKVKNIVVEARTLNGYPQLAIVACCF
jgi:phage FluMu protein Com